MNQYKSKCPGCGTELGYIITPFLSNERRICPNCGMIHYVEAASIDWTRAFIGKIEGKKRRT